MTRMKILAATVLAAAVPSLAAADYQPLYASPHLIAREGEALSKCRAGYETAASEKARRQATASCQVTVALGEVAMDEIRARNETPNAPYQPLMYRAYFATRLASEDRLCKTIFGPDSPEGALASAPLEEVQKAFTACEVARALRSLEGDEFSARLKTNRRNVK